MSKQFSIAEMTAAQILGSSEAVPRLVHLTAHSLRGDIHEQTHTLEMADKTDL